jgi:hypothetical protein
MKTPIRIIVGIFVVLVLVVILTVAVPRYRMQPANEQVAAAKEFAERLFPKLASFQSRTGQLPCFLLELTDIEESGRFKELVRYQATQDGYYVFVQNEGGTNIISYGGSQWRPCTASGSCPPNLFAVHCYGKSGYPKKELLEDRDNNRLHSDE